MAKQDHKQLGFAERLAIVDWLRKHKKQLAEERPSWHDMRERLSNELEIPLEKMPQHDSIRKIAQAAGVAWLPASQGRGSGRLTAAKLQQLLSRLCTEVQAIAKEGGFAMSITTSLQQIAAELAAGANAEAADKSDADGDDD